MDLHAVVHRPGVFDLLAIGDGSSGQGQASTDRLFAAWMNIALIAYVGRDDERCLGHVLAHVELRVANFRPDAIRRLLNDGLIRRDLHDQERKIALPERVSPILDHRRKQFAILKGAGRVRLTLIPNCARDRIGSQRRDHRVVEHAGPLGLGNVLQIGMRLDRLLAHPLLGGRAADVRGNQAQRDAELLLQVAAKEVANRRKITHRLRACRDPSTDHIRLGLVRSLARHGEQPCIIVGRLGDRVAAAVTLLERPLHVRLTATDPDFADQDVFHLDFVLTLRDRHHVRSAGGQRRQLNTPAPVFRHCRDFLAGKADRDFFVLVSGAPNRHFGFLLQHGVIRKQRVGLDRGPRRRGHKESQQ